ncbi:MAG: hypothetical protein R2705_08820 [Ilumatobacteraceae bacterium]
MSQRRPLPREYLRARLGDALVLRTLVDEQATRAAVIGRSGRTWVRRRPVTWPCSRTPGTEAKELPPAPLATSEASGRLQTLMLHGAGRRGRRPAVLAVGGQGTPVPPRIGRRDRRHTVALLDCCHSGGTTRDLSTAALRQWPR